MSKGGSDHVSVKGHAVNIEVAEVFNAAVINFLALNIPHTE